MIANSRKQSCTVPWYGHLNISNRVHSPCRQGKARQGKARQGQARQGKARQGKARQGKAM
jgi:hypothetical protein